MLMTIWNNLRCLTNMEPIKSNQILPATVQVYTVLPFHGSHMHYISMAISAENAEIQWMCPTWMCPDW